MSADKETALWAWLLYDARLPVSQVKELLSLVLERELSLTELFTAPADQISLLGLDSYQNILEMTPNPPVEFQGIRWNAPLYPKRLRELSRKYQPALLTYRGHYKLLERPIIYLLPGIVAEEAEELLPAMVDILLDGNLCPAVFADSPQAIIVLASMAYSDGEAIVFVDQGLDHWQPSEEISRFLHNNRLLALSPMPSTTKSNPKFTPIIQRIAAATAERWVDSSHNHYRQLYADLSRPTLCLAPHTKSGVSVWPDSKTVTDIGEAISWLHDATEPTSDQSTEKHEHPVVEMPSPLSSEQTLALLEQGGKVPDALRKRLMGEK